MRSQAIIVGGGFSGLFTATQLAAAGVSDVVVLDRDPEPGGVARTVRRDGYALEPAAGSFLLPHPHLSKVLDQIGAEVVPAVDAGLRYVYTRNRLVTLPPSPKAALAPVSSWGAKLRAAMEPFVRSRPASEDETLEAFMRRRLGPGLGGLLASVAASGVFAGDPSRLSARSAFPTFPALEDEGGSIVRGMIKRVKAREKGTVRPSAFVPAGGMSGLATAAAHHLGDRYRSGFVVESLRRSGPVWTVEGSEVLEAKHLVLAVRPEEAASLLGGEIAGVLRRSVSAPAVVVGLGGHQSGRSSLPLGFGALVGPDGGMASLGVLFESSYAPDRAPDGHWLVKVIAGGARRPEVVDWANDEIVERIGTDVSRVLGSDIEASFVEIVRHRRGIPQYEVGHGTWLAEIERIITGMPGLHLTGWGYRGLGVGHLATDAAAVAERISGAE